MFVLRAWVYRRLDAGCRLVFVLRRLGRPYRFDLFAPLDIDAPTAEIGDLLGFGQTNLAFVQRVLGAFQFSNVLRQNVVSADDAARPTSRPISNAAVPRS